MTEKRILRLFTRSSNLTDHIKNPHQVSKIYNFR
jgi:hypothetical protein